MPALDYAYRALVSALPAPRKQRRMDGWVNLLTGLGGALTDKVTNTQPLWYRQLSYQALSDMFHSDAVVRKGVTKRPQDSLRKGVTVSIPEDEGGYEVATKFQDAFDDLDFIPVLYEALTWENLFGGSAIFTALDDGVVSFDSQELPVNRESLRKVLWLKTLDCSKLRGSTLPEDQDDDPDSPTFMKPLVYEANLYDDGRTTRIHRDRLIIFPGPLTTEDERRLRQGWGISMLDPAYEALQRNATAWQSAGNALANAQYVVYKLRGLAHMFSMQDGEERARARARAMELAKSMINAVLVDAEDEYIRENPSFGNMPAMMDQFMLDVASAFDMPATVLWGRSPAGMNATGESDMQLWYASCSSYQEHHIRPRAQQLVELLMDSAEGPTEGAMLDGWRVTFPPLYELSEVERADIRSKTSHADDIDIKSGVLLPQEVALSRFRPEGYSIETTIDHDLRHRLQKVEMDMREEELRAGRGPGQTPAEPEVPGEGEEGAEQPETDKGGAAQ
jgi:uncharacterized protein